MTQTVAELIKRLETIQDKDQIFIGGVWVVDDFTHEDEVGEEVIYTKANLAKVATYPAIEKQRDMFQESIADFLYHIRIME